MAPKKRLSAEARREVIEQAASEVFAEHGYHGASIDEIARRSGVSPPVVYDHFESKKALHIEVCSECHPFYTGKQKIVDTAGRVEKFNQKFGALRKSA